MHVCIVRHRYTWLFSSSSSIRCHNYHYHHRLYDHIDHYYLPQAAHVNREDYHGRRPLTTRSSSSSDDVVVADSMKNMYVLQKMTARVFCQINSTTTSSSLSLPSSEPGMTGGNPLTIFRLQQQDNNHDEMMILPVTLQEQLARTCSWESVMIHPYHYDAPAMTFYAPNGQRLAFCAHAAMGASLVLSSSSSSSPRRVPKEPNQPEGENDESIQFTVMSDPSKQQEKQTDETMTKNHPPPSPFQAVIHHPYNIVSLLMDRIVWKEEMIHHPPILYRMLRTYHNITNPPQQVVGNRTLLPTFVNSNILDRTKTLVCVDTMETLHDLVQPPPPSSSSSYAISCDSIDTTGLYIYTPHRDADNSFECRQFPRSSGYPEDPATGIAAASLALSVAARRHRSGPSSSSYQFHQGTAMGQPSLIRIEDIQFHDDHRSDDDHHHKKDDDIDDDDNNTSTSQTIKQSYVSFRIMGQVVIDQQEIIEIEF